jgi:hypothetical protein
MSTAASFSPVAKAGYAVVVMIVVAAAWFLLAPGATAVAVGQIITLTTRFRVMQTDLVTGVGLQDAGAKGRIIAGPRKGVKATQTWWQVDFDTGPDGWVVEGVIGAPSATAPTVRISASPTSVLPGGSTTLTWSSTNATGCTATGSGFAGTRPVSGSLAITPAATGAFGITCSGTGGSASASTTVTVGATAVVSARLSAAPSAVIEGGTTTLTWSSTNATACKAAGDAGFFGTVATAGSVSVRPAASTSYSLSCSGPSGAASATADVAVYPAGSGSSSAFADPDNGSIPDRALHPIAFPTAVGFGKVASVRSPDAVVYKINSLDDVANPADGKITYRECALALPVTTPYVIPGGRPRYCVFDVAGAIQLQSPAYITTPKIYIAGQTSPGGIEFRLGAAYSPVDSLIDTRNGGDHMILRHVRTRTGEHLGRTSLNGDPIRMSGTRYQIIDHVSTMFGTDESLDMACQNCTVQWSIIGPNLCGTGGSGHSSTFHCKTFFLKPAGNITIAYNLSQHGEQRGLNVSVGTHPESPATATQLDAVNNVLYHFVKETGLVSNQFGDVHANYVNNVVLRGPRYNSSSGNFLIGLYASAARQPYGFDVHASGNVTPHTRVAGQFGQSSSDPVSDLAGLIAAPDNLPGIICGLDPSSSKDCSRTGKSVVQGSRRAVAPGNIGFSLRPSEVVPAEQAMRAVLTFAGADRCRDGSCRDNVDELYIDDLRTCDIAPYLMEKGWTPTVALAGGWARLTAGAAKKDSDNDGMPDEWESRFRNTNPAVWDANADADGDGYPNIEEYLNALAQDDVRYGTALSSGSGRLPAYNCGRPMYAPQ